MADLFSFQRTQQIASTSVPTIRVEPNLSAARAFESLGNLVSTAQQTQLQEVQRQQQVVSDQIQIQNLHNRQQAAIQAAEEKAKTAADAASLDLEIITARDKLAAIEDDYNVQMAQNAGNLQAQQALTAQFRESTSTYLASLSTKAQKSVQSEARGDVTSAIKTHATAVATQHSKETALIKKRNAALQLGALQTSYEQSIAEAGTNVAVQQSITTSYVTELGELMGSLDIDTQAAVQDQVITQMRNASTKHAEVFQAYQETELKTNVTNMLPTFFASGTETRTGLYQDFMARAAELNMDKREFGQFMVTNIKNYALATMDVDALQQSFDYTGVNNVVSMLEEIKAIDPRTKVDVEAALQEVENKIKNPIDTAVNSSLNLAIKVQNADAFDVLHSVATDNNTMSKVDLALKQVEFHEKTHDTETVARTMFESAKGMIQVNTLSDSKTRNVVSNLIEGSLIEQFRSGELDYNFLKWQAARNPDIYKKVFRSHLSTAVGTVIQSATTQGKTPEETMQIQMDVINKVDALNSLMSASHGYADSQMKLQVELAKVLASSNYITNIPDALNSIRSSGEVNFLHSSSSMVKNLKADVPSDQFDEAHRVLSLLAEVDQLDRDVAYDAVVNTYSYNEIDGNDFAISGAITDTLLRGGLAADSMEMFQSVLLDEAFVPEEVRGPIQDVINGNNPKVRMINGGLYFTNDEGSSAPLPLNAERRNALIEEMNKRYQDANVPVGIEVVGYDLGQELAKATSEAFGSMKPTLGLLAAGPEYVYNKTIPAIQARVSSISEFPAIVNQHIHLMYVEGKTWEETRAALADEAKTRLERNLATMENIDQEAVDRFMSRIDDVMGDSTLETMKEDVVGIYETMLEFVIPKAEAHSSDEIPADGKLWEGLTLLPDDEEAVVLETVTTPKIVRAKPTMETTNETQFLDNVFEREAPTGATEGQIHQGAEGDGKNAPTTNYGVRTDLHPKLDGESDRQHALRVFRTKFVPAIESMNIKGVDNNALAVMAWNVGLKSPALTGLKGLDMGNKQDFRKAFLKINGPITASGKWMTGLVTARAKDWNMVAELVDPDKVIESYKVYKIEGDPKTYRTYTYADGTERTLYTTKGKHQQSKVSYGKTYTIN